MKCTEKFYKWKSEATVPNDIVEDLEKEVSKTMPTHLHYAIQMYINGEVNQINYCEHLCRLIEQNNL